MDKSKKMGTEVGRGKEIATERGIEMGTYMEIVAGLGTKMQLEIDMEIEKHMETEICEKREREREREREKQLS